MRIGNLVMVNVTAQAAKAAKFDATELGKLGKLTGGSKGATKVTKDGAKAFGTVSKIGVTGAKIGKVAGPLMAFAGAGYVLWNG